MPNHVQLPVVITPSRAELGSRCHRRHFLADVLSRARYSSPSLEFGSLIHAAGANRWLERDWYKTVRDEWHTRFEITDVSKESVSEELALAMMEHYQEHAQLAGPFHDAADDWKLVDVEQRFEIPLKDGILSFQMDRIVYSKSQNWLVIGDIKTASRLDKRWERQWEMSLQMKLYRIGAQTVFDHHGRLDVFIEGLHKNVPSKIQYYVCTEWSPAMLGEAAFNAYHVAEMDQELIQAAYVGVDVKSNLPIFDIERLEELAVRYTPTNYADCYAYNIECPFRRICTADVDERVGILRGEYFVKVEEDY